MQYRALAALVGLSLLTASRCFSQGYGDPPQPARKVNRILEQATWGPALTADPILTRYGFAAWFQTQLGAPPSTFDDQPFLNALGKTNTNLVPIQQQFFRNALNNPDQLRQRVAFALSQIWVVSEVGVTNATAFPPLYRLLSQDAFLNYETIMKDLTLSPAMGKFLNMVNNDKGNAALGTSPNENYAREVMQLFTIGLVQLNTDGSIALDGNGNPQPTYTQSTVSEVARALTGWTYAVTPGKTAANHNPAYFLLPMTANEANHDKGSKTLFPGFTVAAGQTAEQDLDEVIHALFLQPSLPPFVSKQLIQHLVTSNPSAAYVGRVSAVFSNNGKGIRGDMARVVEAILTDSEARANDNPGFVQDAASGHLREPILFVLNLLRGLNGNLSTTSTAANYASQLGENLFNAPSVFSYFSPGYRTSQGLLAPEFQIYSTQSAINRINVVNQAIYAGKLDAGTTFDLSAFTTIGNQQANLLTLIGRTFFHDDLPDSVKTAIITASAAQVSASDKAKAALYVALTSNEFQILQ